MWLVLTYNKALKRKRPGCGFRSGFASRDWDVNVWLVAVIASPNRKNENLDDWPLEIIIAFLTRNLQCWDMLGGQCGRWSLHITPRLKLTGEAWHCHFVKSNEDNFIVLTLKLVARGSIWFNECSMKVSAQSSSKRPTFYTNMAALNEEVPAETGLKVPSGGILAASFLV